MEGEQDGDSATLPPSYGSLQHVKPSLFDRQLLIVPGKGDMDDAREPRSQGSGFRLIFSSGFAKMTLYLMCCHFTVNFSSTGTLYATPKIMM